MVPPPVPAEVKNVAIFPQRSGICTLAPLLALQGVGRGGVTELCLGYKGTLTEATRFIICWVVTSIQVDKHLKDTLFPRDVITRGENNPEP